MKGSSTVVWVVMILYLTGWFSVSIALGVPMERAEAIFAQPVTKEDRASPVWQVLEKLSGVSVVSARFSQRKDVRVLSRPLLSSGKFSFIRGRGVIWATEKPLVQTFVITPNGIREQSEGGEASSLPEEIQPAIAGFTKAFLAIFAGGYEELTRHFTVFFDGTERKWSIGVKPRDEMMAKVIAAITISGGENIEVIDIQERNGDITRVAFSEVSTAGVSLSDLERKYLND